MWPSADVGLPPEDPSGPQDNPLVVGGPSSSAYGACKEKAALCATILSSQIYAAMPKRPLEAVYCEIKPALSGNLFLTQQAMPLES